MSQQITQERLKEALHYDPETGIFIRKVRVGNVKAGDIANNITVPGYIVIGIDNRIYQASRLAWLYMTGSFPNKFIDHKDGNPLNNAWRNLRPASCVQNQLNKGKNRNNTSGYKGVYWHTQSQKWRARASVNGIRVHLGSFDDPELAGNVYEVYAREKHGEFYRPPSINESQEEEKEITA